MHVTYRCVAATTAALLAGSVMIAGSATAGSSALAERAPAVTAHRAVDAPGQDPSTLNGHGLYKLSLANTADGHIVVRWKWKKKASKRLKKWKIVTSTSRLINTDTHTYHAKPKKRSIVVSAAPSVTPASGDYTFVKVYSVPKHGKKHGSSTHWIQAPVTAVPTGSGRVTIGTFNVRDADIAADKGTARSWANRRQRVIDTINSSGAGVVNLQEASGMSNVTGPKGYDVSVLSQATDLETGSWKLVNDQYYPGTGSQGTRILYNSALYTASNEGHAQVSGNRFIEWAEFTDKSTGQTFWDLTMHLFSSTSASGENTRVQEAKQIIAQARALHAKDGAEVFVAGDSNSTIYSKPKGLVHRTFIGAGFYDAFATNTIVNQAYPTTNDFAFPVKPSPNRRDVILSYGGPQGAYWYHNLYYNSPSRLASDHFMQVAQLPLA